MAGTIRMGLGFLALVIGLFMGGMWYLIILGVFLLYWGWRARQGKPLFGGAEKAARGAAMGVAGATFKLVAA